MRLCCAKSSSPPSACARRRRGLGGRQHAGADLAERDLGRLEGYAAVGHGGTATRTPRRAGRRQAARVDGPVGAQVDLALACAAGLPVPAVHHVCRQRRTRPRSAPPLGRRSAPQVERAAAGLAGQQVAGGHLKRSARPVLAAARIDDAQCLDARDIGRARGGYVCIGRLPLPNAQPEQAAGGNAWHRGARRGEASANKVIWRRPPYGPGRAAGPVTLAAGRAPARRAPARAGGQRGGGGRGAAHPGGRAAAPERTMPVPISSPGSAQNSCSPRLPNHPAPRGLRLPEPGVFGPAPDRHRALLRRRALDQGQAQGREF